MLPPWSLTHRGEVASVVTSSGKGLHAGWSLWLSQTTWSSAFKHFIMGTGAKHRTNCLLYVTRLCTSHLAQLHCCVCKEAQSCHCPLPELCDEHAWKMLTDGGVVLIRAVTFYHPEKPISEMRHLQNRCFIMRRIILASETASDDRALLRDGRRKVYSRWIQKKIIYEKSLQHSFESLFFPPALKFKVYSTK